MLRKLLIVIISMVILGSFVVSGQSRTYTLNDSASFPENM